MAAGGLLGDVFLHLLPHSAHSHDHERGQTHRDHTDQHGHSHAADNAIGLSVLSGIVAFFLLEKVVRSYHGGHSHSHGHKHDGDNTECNSSEHNSSQETHSTLKQRKNRRTPTSNKGEGQAVCEHEQHNNVRSTAVLNLVADFAHNITDGLGIGAAYATGDSALIFSTVLAVFIHEIPHEIGDFAMLINSGMSKWTAAKWQMATATGCIVGTLVGLVVGEIGAAWLLPFVAGGFIYIACSSVLPELLEDDSSPFETLKQLFGMLCGVAMMFGICIMEESEALTTVGR